MPSLMQRESIGKSANFLAAMEKVNMAAPADCAVLIEGETGSGKELVARAIHERSRRSAGPFVKLNCAAIPAGLLESELFGHERGAFTGAVAPRMGRMQQAHKGTLFLDEIGDLPLELQPKLLRALQEREFERLGSSQTIRVDVRFVAATNQNLLQMVHQKRFRADLYYRLSVFPIVVPPLRERREDIPLLALHFMEEFAQRMNRDIAGIPEPLMDLLLRHDWPGNVRELQNYIERAVVLSTGNVLTAPPMASTRMPAVTTAQPDRRDQTLEEMEKSLIAKTLDRTNWVVGGNQGAAAILGLPRTTLISRMNKLGILRSSGARMMPAAPLAQGASA